MICRILTPNAFEPLTRTVDYVPWKRGVMLSDLLPDDWDPQTTLAFVDGERTQDWHKTIYRSNTVAFVAGASDPVTILYVVISVASIAIGVSMARKQQVEQPPEPNPDGSSTYGFYGFQNNYTPEGEGVPVVYGRMRTAPAIANQVILGNSVVGGASPSLRENIILLAVISEGPIAGLGEYVGTVETEADQTALTGSLVNPMGRSNTQINGISGENFAVANIAWRTGTLNQAAMLGEEGLPDYENVGEVYSIALTPDVGTASISDTDKPAGSYDPSSTDFITEGSPSEFVSQNISSLSQRGIVQIAFNSGQFEQSNGAYQTQTKTVRIQYRETDSGGTATGNYVLLPATIITTKFTSPFVVDIPFVFVDPSTYGGGSSENGYAALDSVGNDRLTNNTSGGLSIMRPATTLDNSQEWTWTGWVNFDKLLDGDPRQTVFSWSSGSIDKTSVDPFYSVGSIGSGDVGLTIEVAQGVVNPGFLGTTISLTVWGTTSTKSLTRWSATNLNPFEDTWSGKWRHVAVTYKGSGSASSPATVTMYVDGFTFATTGVTSWYNGTQSTSQYQHPAWPTSSSALRIGSFEAITTNNSLYRTDFDLAEFGIYTGILSPETITLLGAPGVGEDALGRKVVGIKDFAETDAAWTLAAPLDDDDVTSGVYKNYSLGAGSSITQAQGHLNATDPSATVKATGGPVWTGTEEVPKRSYWQVQVFVSRFQENQSQLKNVATIEQITAFDNQEYTYPHTAIANVRIGADEQVQNSRPAVTFDVRGRIIDTWDGTVDGTGDPVLTSEWSSNPAWIAADLLTHKRYGLGTEFDRDDLDWPSFYEWAYFCDEGVPDAFGEVSFFGVELAGYATDGVTPHLILYVPLTDTGGTSINTLPVSWRRSRLIGANNDREIVSSVSITSVLADGLTDEWVTANDIENGLNAASNRLSIDYITYEENTSGFHGYTNYAKVYVIWQRLDGSDPIWPTGYSAGSSYFADDVGLTTFGNASGYERRCRFDGVFDQKEEDAWEAVLDIFSAGRAMPVKAGAKIYAIVDKPRPRVAMFGQGNIVPDSLKIQYTGPLEAPNSLEGDILDEMANYERRTILVDHPSIQDPTAFDSFRKTTVKFRGVTRRSQALRDATKRLNELHLRRKSVVFQVGPDAVNLLPGDRFGLSHDVPEYGTSGRLRRAQTTVNVFPNAGSFYKSWDAQGGTCALSGYALAREDSSITLPTGFTTSDNPAALLYANVTGASRTQPAAVEGQDGSDFSSATSPAWASQHVALSNALYPPAEIVAPLDQVFGKASYQSAFSFYVKEPSIASAEYVFVNVFVLVDKNGTLVQHSNYAKLAWSSGALAVSSTDAALTTTTASAGNGWYRVSVVYTAASDSGVSNGDYLQARVYAGGRDQASTWNTVADGGKGIQFLKWADPLDISFSDWTLNNRTTSGGATGTNAIDNSTTVAPPFYTQTDGTYGHVVTMRKDEGIAFGTTPPCMIQNVTLPTGSGVSTWNGERICLTYYAKVNSANGANNTTIYTDLRVGTSTDSNGRLDGDGVRSVISTAGGSSWVLGSISKTEAAGTVNNEAHAQVAVRQTSSANDANWKEITVSFDYTPSSGSLTNISLGISIDGNGTAAGGDEVVDIWGIRLHGRGTSSTVLANRFWHQGLLLWGGMYQRSSGSVSTFQEGSNIFLDRDITLDAGNEYEVLLRSSFSPDVGLEADATEVVTVDGSQVPGSGSSTITAGSAVKVSTPTKFTTREGDLYSFGKTGESHEDFVVQSITLDPDKMLREITAAQYNEAIYNDTGFGTQGVTTITSTADSGTTNDLAADLGYGFEPAFDSDSGFRFAANLSPATDDRGGVTQLLSASWRFPVGVRRPKAMRLVLSEAYDRIVNTQPPVMQTVAEVPFGDGATTVEVADLVDGRGYYVHFQMVGWNGTAPPPRKSPRVGVQASFALTGDQITAPSLTTTTRGFTQVYELLEQRGTRNYDVIEGRIGGWVLGSPGFLIDPDAKDISSEVTLVGQASTPTGRTGMTIHARKRLSTGAYGVAQRVDGDEQLKDVGFGNSTSAENNYGTAGTVPVDLNVSSNVLEWASSSSALTATYALDIISLGSAKRVIANCAVEAYQIRPETLADCAFTLGDATGRRWSLEGPMDNLDGDNSTVLIEWRWSSTSSASGEAWRVFRPGEVYAQTIEFRVTFTRPTSSYQMRCERILSQALTLPAFEADDIDGGTF